MKHFYSHLIQLEDLFIELEDLNLKPDEKHHLGSLIDSNLHHTILNAVLDELDNEDKDTFLRLVSSNQHDKIWEHLNSKVDNIEEKIKKAALAIKVDLHKDVKEVKGVKNARVNEV